MNIGIAGAGLVGRLLAWQLLRSGHQVTLFDRDAQTGELSAGHVAAAMIAPFSEIVNCERKIFQWGLQSLTLWPQLLSQLKDDTGTEVFFQHTGSIVVAHQQDQSSLDHFNHLLCLRAAGHRDDIEFLGDHRLRELEPTLAENFSTATFLHNEGCLDNWALLNELAIAIKRLGGSWHFKTQVNTVSPFTIKTELAAYQFDTVIDCRGVGAKSELPDLRGVRGEVLWVQAPEVKITRPTRLMHPRYQLYIAPRPNDIYVIGATEIESESMAPITIRSSLELQSALYSISSRFSEACILKAYANCRPAFSDNLPRIAATQGLLSVNGLYRHGYLLAPAVIRAALTALATDDSPEYDLPTVDTLESAPSTETLDKQSWSA